MKIKKLSLGLALGIMGAFFMLVATYYPQISGAIFDMEKGTIIRDLMVNVYPFYDPATVIGILAGVVFGFLDGFVFGFILGFLYNLMVKFNK